MASTAATSYPSQILKFYTLFLFLFYVKAEGSCEIEKSKRVRCGPRDINKESCQEIHCCYEPNTNQCFFSTKSAPRFSSWSTWSDCSESCGGGGTQRRDRTCMYEGGLTAPDQMCNGKSFETTMCNTHRCGEDKPKPTVTCVERFTSRCEKRKSDCKSDKDLQRDCPLTCGTCQQQKPKPVKAAPSIVTSLTGGICKDISPTCGTAKELCTRGFLTDTFRKWCRKTCNNCGDLPAASIEVNIKPTIAPVPVTFPPTKHSMRECVDEFDTCPRIKSMCGMPKYRREMTIYCRRTCDLCFVEPRATTMFGADQITTTQAPTQPDTTIEITTSNEVTTTQEVTTAKEVTTAGEVNNATTAAPCEEKLVGACKVWASLCFNKRVLRICPVTCGTCVPTISATVAPRTALTTTTTTQIPTTTTEKPTTEKSTTEKSTTTEFPKCKDRYKNCNTIASQCNVSSYEKTLRKHCSFTCNFDNCRGL